MEAAKAFAVTGETMDIIIARIRTGQLISPALFIDIITEKCRLINSHFLNVRDHLKIVTNASSTTATVTFHDNYIADSKLTTVTLTNTSTLEGQLVHLWLEVQQILKHFNEIDRIAEMASIKSFYHNFRFKQNWAERDTYEY